MAEAIPEILYDRNQILAVSKAEGLATLPEQNSRSASLLEILQSDQASKLFVVHRLDKVVSGVILFARDAETHRWLNDQFQSRQIQKAYLALVHGRMPHQSGEIDKPLRQFGSGRVAVDWKRGKASKTSYQVKELLVDFTFLSVFPLTGRRHQIRSHLFSVDHPIVGDLLYGDRLGQRAYPRMMLHAESIRFQVPSGEKVTISSGIPISFGAVLNQARHGKLNAISLQM